MVNKREVQSVDYLPAFGQLSCELSLITIMTQKELPKLIPFSIAFIFVLIYLVEILLNPVYNNEQGYQITYSFHNSILYAGFGLLLVLLLIILNKPAWKYLCAIVMILALTPLVSFYNSELFLVIFGIEIELKTLGLLILHFKTVAKATN